MPTHTPLRIRWIGFLTYLYWIFLLERFMDRIIKQTVTFHATPEEVYDLLMDSKKHSEFTKEQAKMSAKVGGIFSAYNGYITGKNIKLEPGKLIIQSWHAADWAEGHQSTVVYALQKIKTGTKLSFSHTDVPREHFEDIKQGWIDNYWIPMKKYFAIRS
jgi:activator of HSP90 ATPase